MRSHVVAALALASGSAAHAQQPLAALASRLASVSAPVGFEAPMADTLARLLPGATRDRAGNVILRLGRGSPARLVACPMDEPGWVVGGVTSNGYLTLRRAPGRVPPLFDQQLEGHRVTVWGVRGAVPAVVAVRSVHLTRGRTTDDAPFTSDNAYVDVGATTEAEARALGIRETSPVLLAKRPHAYGDSLIAAPVMGRRTACAALVRAAATRPAGSLVVAFVVEQGLSARGLQTVVNTLGPFDETVLLDAGAADSAVSVARDSTLGGRAGPRAERWRLRTRHGGTPVESVHLGDAFALERRLASWIGTAR